MERLQRNFSFLNSGLWVAWLILVVYVLMMVGRERKLKREIAGLEGDAGRQAAGACVTERLLDRPGARPTRRARRFQRGTVGNGSELTRRRTGRKTIRLRCGNGLPSESRVEKGEGSGERDDNEHGGEAEDDRLRGWRWPLVLGTKASARSVRRRALTGTSGASGAESGER